MANIIVTRTQRICALCKYWNGAIGCTTIKPQVGAHSFQLDAAELRMCFKPGVGIMKSAQQTCQYFRPRYDD